MTSSERIYRLLVLALSFVFLALGMSILVNTLAHGGGALSVGVLLGVVFLAVGAGRLWIAARTSRS